MDKRIEEIRARHKIGSELDDCYPDNSADPTSMSRWYQHDVGFLLACIAQREAEFERVRRERDAAVERLNDCRDCEDCAHNHKRVPLGRPGSYGEPCKACQTGKDWRKRIHWKWRGPEDSSKPCASTDCPHASDVPCPAAEGCGGYTEED